MKKRALIYFILFIVTVFHSSAQTDTIYFSSNWEVCSVNEARFFRIVTPRKGKFIVADYYMTGIPQMIAEASSGDPVIKEGKCTFYDENGLKSSQGMYRNNKFHGRWVQWSNHGQDSVVTEYVDGNKLSSTATIQAGNEEKVFTIVEEMPEFPGGETEMLNYLAKNIKYPAAALGDNIQGRVYISFVVDTEGNIRDAKVIRSVRQDLDDAALKVVNEMPQWKPGYQNGKPVLVAFNLPINFHLNEKKKKK